MDDNENVNDTAEQESTPSPAAQAVGDIVEDERGTDVDSTEQVDTSLTDAIAALSTRFDAIDERLGAIERAQRDSFASLVQSGAVVRDVKQTDVEQGEPKQLDYDLSI